VRADLDPGPASLASLFAREPRSRVVRDSCLGVAFEVLEDRLTAESNDELPVPVVLELPFLRGSDDVVPAVCRLA